MRPTKEDMSTLYVIIKHQRKYTFILHVNLKWYQAHQAILVVVPLQGTSLTSFFIGEYILCFDDICLSIPLCFYIKLFVVCDFDVLHNHFFISFTYNAWYVVLLYNILAFLLVVHTHHDVGIEQIITRFWMHFMDFLAFLHYLNIF